MCWTLGQLQAEVERVTRHDRGVGRCTANCILLRTTVALAPRISVARPEPAPEFGRENTRTWRRQYLARVIVTDFLTALIAGLAALIVRFGVDVFSRNSEYLALAAALPLAWVSSLALVGAHKSPIMEIGSEEFRRVASAGVYVFAGIAMVAYFSHLDLSRGYILTALPLVTLTGISARYTLRQHLHRLRRHGKCMYRTVAVGHGVAVTDLAAQLRREKHHGMEVVGACVPRDQWLPSLTDALPVLGDFQHVPAAVREVNADRVTVLTCPEMSGTELRRLAWQLEKTGTELVVAPGLVDVAGPRTMIRPIAGLPLLHIEHPELSGWRRIVKDIFDRTSAGLGLLLTLPLFVLIALAVRATSPGPAFFRQVRVSRQGQTFSMLKFRTMWADAEALKMHLAGQNVTDGPLFKIRRDPRVTPLGRTLRKYSLDELPQLINIVLGQMSLVGPRPPLPEEVAQYGDDARRRLVVKAGLTGLWQIGGRSDLSWDESVRLDLRYVENWSLALDVVILWKTLSAVLKGSGAY